MSFISWSSNGPDTYPQHEYTYQFGSIQLRNLPTQTRLFLSVRNLHPDIRKKCIQEKYCHWAMLMIIAALQSCHLMQARINGIQGHCQQPVSWQLPAAVLWWWVRCFQVCSSTATSRSLQVSQTLWASSARCLRISLLLQREASPFCRG